MPDEQATEQLNTTETVELSAEDKKIAAKRAKKKNVTLEVSEDARRQELNAKNAQMLTIEFNNKLNALGFVLEPRIQVLTDAIVARFELRPMNQNELARYKDAMEKKVEPVAEASEPTNQ